MSLCPDHKLAAFVAGNCYFFSLSESICSETACTFYHYHYQVHYFSFGCLGVSSLFKCLGVLFVCFVVPSIHCLMSQDTI